MSVPLVVVIRTSVMIAPSGWCMCPGVRLHLTPGMYMVSALLANREPLASLESAVEGRERLLVALNRQTARGCSHRQGQALDDHSAGRAHCEMPGPGPWHRIPSAPCLSPML